MSSTNKTANLKMHSWVRTDPVVCEDFNENFNKIDSAIGDMRAKFGGCEIYTGSYTGTGETVHSLSFPKTPVFFMVMKESTSVCYSGFIREGAKFSGQDANVRVSLSGGTVTFTSTNTSQAPINKLDYVYHYFALARAQ